MPRTVCVSCGKDLTAAQRKRKQTYCSRSCAWLNIRQMAWRDKGRETRKFRNMIRQRVREDIAQEEK